MCYRSKRSGLSTYQGYNREHPNHFISRRQRQHEDRLWRIERFLKSAPTSSVSMKLITVSLCLIALSDSGWSSELTKAVLQSNDLIDIYPKLKGTRYEVVTVEQVPDKLFAIILSGKATNEEWRALGHYSDLSDA